MNDLCRWRFYQMALAICTSVLLCSLSHAGLRANNLEDMESAYPLPQLSMDLVQHNPEYDRRMLQEGSEIAPLFQGRGIHYSFIWVGNPAQRVSVIMDTGSHHTAFPCVGCKCGKHVSG